MSARREAGACSRRASSLATIATTDSGIALIYHALDALVAQFELEDAAVVLEERELGRQVFCAGRRPLGAADEELLVAPRRASTRSPRSSNHDFDRSLMLSLCVLALRLDVLRYDAWHDPLTGLFDRRSFDRLLEMAIARSNRYGWPFTLVMLDLDHFKQINDDEGHPAGDAALRELGERFRRALRFGDNAAPHRRRRVRDDPAATPRPTSCPCCSSACAARRRLRAASARAFSFGVAQCPARGDRFDELVELADTRLYEAKEA